MWNILRDQELCHVRNEAKKLLESVAKRNNYREFLLRRAGAWQLIVVLPIRHVIVYRLVSLDVVLTIAVV